MRRFCGDKRSSVVGKPIDSLLMKPEKGGGGEEGVGVGERGRERES